MAENQEPRIDETKTRLEFIVEIEPDEHGVFDGRELAHHFISSAFALLVPYTHACPACTDKLFSNIANDAMAQLHEEGRERGRLRSAYYSIGDEADKNARMAAHISATKAITADLMNTDAHDHAHDPEEDGLPND